MKTTSLLAVSLLGATAAGSVWAQDIGGEDTDIATAVILTTEDTSALAGDDNPLTFVNGATRFTFYGQINQGILTYDDGFQSKTYFPVDNDNSGSRVGLKTNTDLGNGWEMGGLFELGITPSSTSAVNVLDPTDSDWSLDRTDIRHLEVSFAKRGVGRLSVGQGSMATDGITGVDLSGTGVIAGRAVTDMAGGQLVRDDLGGFTGDNAGAHFSTMNGSRRFRIRYDSPRMNGVVFSAAYGQEVLNDNDDNDYVDLAARYEQTINDYKISAGIGYGWNDDVSEVFSGSASMLHTPTGLSLTVAAGHTDDGDSSSFGYVKLGYETDYFAVGSTAFSVDYYDGNDIYEAGARSNSVGLVAVQRFDDQSLELYAGIREYSFDGATQDFADGQAVLAGLRWQF